MIAPDEGKGSDSTSLSLDHLDDLDLHILLILLQILEGSLHLLRANLFAALHQIRKEDFIATRAKPNVAPRKTFHEITDALSPIHFRRMFRMNRDSFNRLCDCITSKLGEDAFKSDQWFGTTSSTSNDTGHEDANAARRSTYCAKRPWAAFYLGK